MITTLIQNWLSTRWRPFTNTIQHLHCRHTTTQSSGSVMSYRDGITITSTHTSTSAASLYNRKHTKHPPPHHGYKTQHSSMTELHTVSNTVALDMTKAFNTINIHTLIGKLLQTKIPGTIIKFIAFEIRGRKAYTTYRNHTCHHNVNSILAFYNVASYHQHYSTFTLQTHHHPEHRFSHGLQR